MGWELLFWLLLCFPLNIAFFASSFYQVIGSCSCSHFLLLAITPIYFALQCANEGSQVFPLLCVYGLNGGIRFAFDDHLNQLPVDALPGIRYELKKQNVHTCGQL
ncbi:uncharacterized protein LOC107645451 [Arachis ipaensis]|uniref:uncharacterized protein LOC107645451 n=1 Tax=Arachis ipaensis TaxID=130454 RepID=UPI000A2B0423|nr:uncharacterized protein LOC107645451 [Arachis ipaensis]